MKKKVIIYLFLVLFISFLFSENESKPLYLRVTPNNDGKNDTFIYQCYNPRDLSVKGEIFDIYGKKVGDMKIMSQTGYYYNLQWIPPKDIKGGIYIYQITIAEKTIKGTFMIVK